MSTDTANTRTTERVESRVETVEVTEYQCSNCGQWYSDESDIVPVALNAEADTPADADEVAALCDGCAEAVFGYEGDSGASIESLRQAVLFPYQDEETIKAFQSKLVSASITVTVAAIVFWVGLQVVNEFAAQAVTTDPSQVEYIGGPVISPGVMSAFEITFLLIILATIVAGLKYMPRRF